MNEVYCTQCGRLAESTPCHRCAKPDPNAVTLLNAAEVERVREMENDLRAANEEIKELRAVIERMLDAGEYVWSEADKANVYSIYLPESSVDEFVAMLPGAREV